MTREEASKILNNFFYCIVFPQCKRKLFSYRRLEKALNMALEALKPTERNKGKCVKNEFYDDWVE